MPWPTSWRPSRAVLFLPMVFESPLLPFTPPTSTPLVSISISTSSSTSTFRPYNRSPNSVLPATPTPISCLELREIHVSGSPT